MMTEPQIASTHESLQSLITKHQEIFRNMRNSGSSEKELQTIRRTIAELALKQKSLYESNADERDNNAEEIDAILHRTIEHLPDETRNKALFLRDCGLLIIDAARALETKREAKKRRRLAMNSSVSNAASGRNDAVKRRSNRPLRSNYGPRGSEFIKNSLFENNQAWLRHGPTGMDHLDEFDVLDIDVAVKNSKIRSRRCKICEAGGEIEVCKSCESGYHIGVCVPATSSKLFYCPECLKKNVTT